MAGVSQFACVQLYGFHSSFLIVFSPYTEDDPRFQHLVVRLTVCSTHCSCAEDDPRFQQLVVRLTVCSTHCSCATNVHLIPESGDDEVYHMPMSRSGMRSSGLVSIFLFEHGVGDYQIELSA